MIRKFWVAVLGLATTLAFSFGLALGAAQGVALADESSQWSINGSIDISPGEHRGNLSTVNGSIRVGADAMVGEVKTVNGDVKLESRARASALDTVNGSIDLKDGARVQGAVHTVNGSLHVDNAADVAGDLTNVNGNIHVAAAHVSGSVNTTSANIDLGPDAHIDGNVVVKKNNGWQSDSTPPRVVVEPGTIVKGKLRFERPVKLYVSDHATIGPVEGAEVVQFSGDHPPG
jgi:DUF4097 and DUF4098 domain-containing protein YvlB